MSKKPDVSITFRDSPPVFNREIEIWKSDKLFILYADQINRICRIYGLKTVLEVGCGCGYVPLHMDKNLIWEGMDGFQGCVDEAKKNNPNSTVVVGDLRSFRHSEVDLACSFAVVKHFYLDEVENILKRIISLGRYSMNTVQCSNTVDAEDSEASGNPNPHNWLSTPTVEKIVKSAGHEIIECVERWRGGPDRWEDFLITKRIN